MGAVGASPTRDELRDLLTMWLILIPAGTKKRYATDAHERARSARQVIAEALLDRLMHYPAFGPEPPAEAHRAGGHNQHRE